MTLHPATAFLLLLVCAATPAGTGYKCVAADDSVSFQDRPCPPEARSSEFTYRDQDSDLARESPPAPPVEPAQAPVLNDPVQNEPAPAEPRAAPEFYACTRPDGERYYSDDGVSRPYAMPLGVLGYPGSPLGRAGVSAPELSRPPIAQPGTNSDLAAGYVTVQDDCRRLSPAAACAALRSERDKVERQARRTFREERAPIDARLRTLNDKLGGC